MEEKMKTTDIFFTLVRMLTERCRYGRDPSSKENRPEPHSVIKILVK